MYCASSQNILADHVLHTSHWTESHIYKKAYTDEQDIKQDSPGTQSLLGNEK